MSSNYLLRSSHQRQTESARKSRELHQNQQSDARSRTECIPNFEDSFDFDKLSSSESTELASIFDVGN